MCEIKFKFIFILFVWSHRFMILAIILAWKWINICCETSIHYHFFQFFRSLIGKDTRALLFLIAWWYKWCDDTWLQWDRLFKILDRTRIGYIDTRWTIGWRSYYYHWSLRFPNYWLFRKNNELFGWIFSRQIFWFKKSFMGLWVRLSIDDFRTISVKFRCTIRRLYGPCWKIKII